MLKIDAKKMVNRRPRFIYDLYISYKDLAKNRDEKTTGKSYDSWQDRPEI